MPGDTEAMCGSHSTSNDLGKKPALKDILENEGVSRYTLSDKLWEYLQNYAKKHRAKGNGFGFGMPDLGGQTRTLSARYYKDGSEILIGQKDKNPRKLTPRECARLQGYPDEYRIVVSDTQAYKQFGNSVVVPLVAQFTLQQGVSPNQLEQMRKENVVLVVPKMYHHLFPTTEYPNVISLEEFIDIVLEKQRTVYGV